MQTSQRLNSYYSAIRYQHLEKLHFHCLLQSPPQVIYKYTILISIKKKKEEKKPYLQHAETGKLFRQFGSSDLIALTHNASSPPVIHTHLK